MLVAIGVCVICGQELWQLSVRAACNKSNKRKWLRVQKGACVCVCVWSLTSWEWNVFLEMEK